MLSTPSAKVTYSGYTVENMVEDVESVPQALGLGQISTLGHSYGGGSKLVILSKSGEMNFVDQPGMFENSVEDFLEK